MVEPSLQIYTEDFFLTNKLKSLLKMLLGMDLRGPQAVAKSLFSGLKELKVNFSVNKNLLGTNNIVCVLSGVKTLKWAIKQKELGKIKKLVAGPNIVISAYDKDGLINNIEIDVIIVPCQWVKDYYLATAPELSRKIVVWAAGVDLPEECLENKDIDFLVYNKVGDTPLVKKITETLESYKYTYQVINYGQFRQKEYFKLLQHSKYEIYLSNSESQGLAMFEAWARNIPTLILEKGKFQKDGTEISGQISGPYLSKEVGLSFANLEDFKGKLNIFVKQTFSPRRQVENNFTNRICAQKYSDICYDK